MPRKGLNHHIWLYENGIFTRLLSISFDYSDKSIAPRMCSLDTDWPLISFHSFLISVSYSYDGPRIHNTFMWPCTKCAVKRKFPSSENKSGASKSVWSIINNHLVILEQKFRNVNSHLPTCLTGRTWLSEGMFDKWNVFKFVCAHRNCISTRYYRGPTISNG